MERKLTKRIQVGPVAVGGGAPVSIQSMLNTRTTDVEGSLAQIRALAAAGCEIARLAVPDMEAAEAFGDICAASPLPLVADIHFDYRERSDYPLHIGVTETGTARMGTIKSAMGIGALLCQGIGDTMRVSLTADPVQEVLTAKDILKAAGLRKTGVNIIACPTCGRTRIDLIGLANQVDQALAACEKPITVAVMGCVVNGPGEAREADIGIAGGDGCGILFVRGKQLKKLPYDELLPTLLEYIEKL